MINEIKTIVKNYLSNAKLTSLMIGTVVNDGIKVSDRLIIPNELIKGDLKEFVAVEDKVRLIRNQGGQEFYIVEIMGKKSVIDGTVVSEGINIGKEIIPMNLIFGNKKSGLSLGDNVRLLRNLGGNNYYVLEVIAE